MGFIRTGTGRPSIGSWLSYGLGSMNADLPTFVAMSSRGTGRAGQPLYDRLWGSGFLPSRFQGVKFRNQGAPVLDIFDPEGVDRSTRRLLIDRLAQLNQMRFDEVGDPEIQTRIAQYELAYRMQTSVPKLLHLLGIDHKRLIFPFQGRDFRLTDVHGKIVRELLA